MGEAKRRQEAQASGVPTIPKEVAREISKLLEAEDNASAGEKAVAAIIDFGLDTMLAAFDFVTKFTFMVDESNGPFWTSLVKGFIARQPERRSDESNEEYDARVAIALSELGDGLQERLFTTLQVPPEDRKGMGVSPDPIRVGDRFVNRMCLVWTREGMDRLVSRMVEDIRSGAIVP